MIALRCSRVRATSSGEYSGIRGTIIRNFASLERARLKSCRIACGSAGLERKDERDEAHIVMLVRASAFGRGDNSCASGVRRRRQRGVRAEGSGCEALRPGADGGEFQYPVDNPGYRHCKGRLGRSVPFDEDASFGYSIT